VAGGLGSAFGVSILGGAGGKILMMLLFLSSRNITTNN
jgi:hypothetical protein